MMKKTAYLVSVLCLFTACQPSPSGQLNSETYLEAHDPDPTDYSDQWQHVKGFQAAFGSLDERYSRSAVPAVNANEKLWKTTAWRGERVNTQLLLWSVDDVEQVKCRFSSFKNTKGDKLPAAIGKASFVRYVLTDIFDQGCGYRKPEDFPVSLVADGLDPLPCMDIPACSTRPVWLSLDIPQQAIPGVYRGKVEILSCNKSTIKLDLEIEVLEQTLPDVADWEYHLDLWQHPSAVARVEGVKPWSEEHWSLLKETMGMLAGAGQKVITATLNKDPWNNQCYDRYEDMILWTRKADGSWQYDYTVFDRWIEFMMELGVTKMINCYSMAPWNNELHYLDETTGEHVTISTPPGTPEFKEIWSPFLKDFCTHLQDKGWLEITNIAMDERAPEIMRATLQLLQEEAPGLGVALADNHRSYQEYSWLRDICVEYGATFAKEDLTYRKENGLISTYYVYCATEFPNVFTFSDPAEAVYISWYAIASGMDGFLRWAYNSWTENPLIDSRFRTWPAGDTYIVYPGGRSSIRFERLREGIQDAEKVRILRNQFAAKGETRKAEQLERILSLFDFTGKPDEPCSTLIHQAKEQLALLSK